MKYVYSLTNPVFWTYSFMGYFLCQINPVISHGRLMNPPARNAMWRFGYGTIVNYDDNQNWCGGALKYFENGEKCGICGDDFSDPQPRQHEIGGMYDSKIVVRRYAPGQIIDAEIQLTANHLGYFQFRLCPVKDDTQEVTQECLDSNLLKVLNGDVWDDKFTVTSDEMAKDFTVKVKLPHHLACNRCIFQWTYVAANTWGTCINGTEAKGCGAQETFVNCADIGIIMNSGSIPPGKQPIYVAPPQNAILEPEKPGDNGTRKFLVIKSQVCVGTDEFKDTPGIDDWCQMNCLRYPQNCPKTKCKCLEGCHSIGDFKLNEGSDSYCQYHCLVYPKKNCTEDRCQCF